MLTKFGKVLRKLRIDNGELLKDMAEKLDVTSAYLSAVENGKRNVPQDWVSKITKIYSLNEEQSNELKNAAEESQLNIKVDLENLNREDRDLMIAFAREFKELNDEERNLIKNILLNGKKQ